MCVLAVWVLLQLGLAAPHMSIQVLVTVTNGMSLASELLWMLPSFLTTFSWDILGVQVEVGRVHSP